MSIASLLLRCGAVLLALLWFAGCTGAGSGEAGTEGPRHLILIVVDTLRADVIGCYGGQASTPSIDSLAAEGVRFSRAYSHIPITGPSHSSIFTSLLPQEHGVHNNGQSLADNQTTMAEILQAEGWHTAAFISLGVLKKKWGFDQGFVEYHPHRLDGWRTAGEVNTEVLPWIDKLDHGKLFLWVHYSDPHDPYTPPGADLDTVLVRLDGELIARIEADGKNHLLPVSVPPGSSRLVLEAEHPPLGNKLKISRMTVMSQAVSLENVTGLVQVKQRAGVVSSWTGLPVTAEIHNPGAVACETELRLALSESMNRQTMWQRYHQEVAYVDAAIAELVSALKARQIWQESVVVLVSDHGEGLRDHELQGHIHQLYDTLLRVPLILVAPGRLSPGVVEEMPVSLVDILPTTFELLDVKAPEGIRGRSIILPRTDQDAVRPVLAETYRPEAESDRLAIVVDQYKYILTIDSGTEELYDLAQDPGELRDLAAEKPELVQRLRVLLERQRSAGLPAAEVLEPELTEEELSMLSALGYRS
jgi:arylsulfatase A-like enzyme